MTTDLRPYPEYKETGLPWLGRVPKYWECKPLKRVVAINQRVLPETTDADYRFDYLDIGAVGSGHLRAKPVRLRFGDCPSRARRIVRRGDTIVSTVRTYLKAVHHFEGDVADLIVSTGFAVLTPPPTIFSPFFGFLAQGSAFVDQVVANSTGVVYPAIGEGRLGSIAVAIPPEPDEQKSIARFLAAVDAKVRRFIRNRRRLIEVLNEQKQAIINRAVTRGLDPNAPLKPSGIDWLGDIPEHWLAVRLGRLIDLVTGFPFKSSGFTDAPTDIRLLRGINVSPGRIRWDSVVRWSEPDAAELSAFALREGDIVFGMDRPVIGGGIRVAMAANRDVPSLLLQRVARLRAHSELNQRYLLMLLQDRRYADYLAPIFTGISVPHISPAQISNYRVALPPLEEQTAIAEHVLEKSRDLDAATDRAEREIDLIREYRTRLIADVVTGKLDVRGAAAGLSDGSDKSDKSDTSDESDRSDEADEADGSDGSDALLEDAP